MQNLFVLVTLIFSAQAFAQRNAPPPPKMHKDQNPTKVQLKDEDYRNCLNTLNEKTNMFKGKIFLLDENGQTFVAKLPNGNVQVVGEKAAFLVTNVPDCKTSHAAFEGKLNPVDAIQPLYDMAFMKETANREELKQGCKNLPLKPPPTTAEGKKSVTP